MLSYGSVVQDPHPHFFSLVLPHPEHVYTAPYRLKPSLHAHAAAVTGDEQLFGPRLITESFNWNRCNSLKHCHLNVFFFFNKLSMYSWLLCVCVSILSNLKFVRPLWTLADLSLHILQKNTTVSEEHFHIQNKASSCGCYFASWCQDICTTTKALILLCSMHTLNQAYCTYVIRGNCICISFLLNLPQYPSILREFLIFTTIRHNYFIDSSIPPFF